MGDVERKEKPNDPPKPWDYLGWQGDQPTIDDLPSTGQQLQSLRAAWDQHMATCPQHAKVPSPEEVDAWMNAPSNTASAELSREPTPGAGREGPGGPSGEAGRSRARARAVP